MATKTNYHIPALLSETLEGLTIQASGRYVDVTFGGGGHSAAILEQLNDDGRLLAFDQDIDAHANSIEDNRLLLLHNNFRYMKRFLRYHDFLPVDGILADLGISSHQIDEPARGFSTRFEGKLDMRMDNRKELTAATILNTYKEEDLYFIFSHYGELEKSHRLAQIIVNARKQTSIDTIEQLKEIVKPVVPHGKENKYLAQLFQSLRIVINDEVAALSEMLLQTIEVLKPGGRLAVISYHSIEDRLVKNFMKTGNFQGKQEKDFYGNVISPFKMITRKAIIPQDTEVESNSRARSAKLRIAEKI